MRKNKFNVSSKAKRTVDGKVFMSMKESKRYIELKELESTGQITQLELQPRFTLQIGFIDNAGQKHREIAYVADFKYFDKKLKRIVIEDVKGMKTDIYKIKKKLFLYAYQDLLFKET